MPQYSVAPDALHHGVGPLRLDAEPAERVELQFARRGVLDDPTQQRDAVLLGEVHGQALADHQRRPVARNVGEPGRVGDRRGDDVAVFAGRKELPAQVGDVGVVDVVPLDARARVQPVVPAVQSAAEVQHDRLGVHGQELARPVVEVRGPGGHRRRVRAVIVVFVQS